MWNESPPAGLGRRPPAAFTRVFDGWTQVRFGLAMDGICPNCACEMGTEIPHSDAEEASDAATLHRSENCKYDTRVPLFGHVVSHPATIPFFYERGVDVTEMPYWQLRSLAGDGMVPRCVETNGNEWTESCTHRKEYDSFAVSVHVENSEFHRCLFTRMDGEWRRERRLRGRRAGSRPRSPVT